MGGTHRKWLLQEDETSLTTLALTEDAPIDPNEPVYCICQRVAFGGMVGCDNDDCELEWFHFPCVGLTEKVGHNRLAMVGHHNAAAFTNAFALLCLSMRPADGYVVLPELHGEDGSQSPTAQEAATVTGQEPTCRPQAIFSRRFRFFDTLAS